MNILIVPAFLGPHGGLETYIASLATAAVECGHEVDVVTPRPVLKGYTARRGVPQSVRFLSAYEVWNAQGLNRIQHLAATVKFALAHARRPDGEEASRLCDRPFNAFLRSFWEGPGCGLLAGHDVLHIVGKPKRFVIDAARVANQVGVGVVYSEIAQVTPAYAARDDLKDFANHSNRCRVVLTYYDEQAEDVRRLFNYRGEVVVVEQWAEWHEERLLGLLRPRAGGEEAPMVFGSLCRLSPEKGLETLLRGFARAVGVANNIRLRVAGTGQLDGRLRALAAELSLNDRVQFTGFVDDPLPFYESLDAFVICSIEEGGPITGVEAMAAGLPVVTTSAGAMPSRIRDGVEGLLIGVGDEHDLAEALVRLAADRDARLRMGRAARDRYIDICKSEVCKTKLQKVWSDVAGRRAEARTRAAPDSSPFKVVYDLAYRASRKAVRAVRSRFYRRRCRVSVPGGASFLWPADPRYPSAMVGGTYEPELAGAIVRNLNPGDCFFDVGSNAGYISLFVKANVDSSTVVAFEPLPENIRMIRRIQKLNPKHKFQLVEAAVGSAEGYALFCVTSNNANGRLDGVSWESAKRPVGTITVRVINLVDHFNKFHPRVIKIDTEGAEVQILSSLGGPDRWAVRPIFFIEPHGAEAFTDAHRILSSWDYRIESLEGRPLALDSSPEYLVGRPF